MAGFTSFDLTVLYALSVSQIGLLITALVQLAGVRARMEDHSRRLSHLERYTS